MRNNRMFMFGLVLLLTGIIGVMANYGIISMEWEHLWPLFFLAGGLMFELGFFLGGSRQPGFLVPGGILITIGAIFLICVNFGWVWMRVIWPMFILAPAVGLLQLYVFGPKDRAILVPVGILGLIGLMFLFFNFMRVGMGGTVFPIILIIIGTMVIASNIRR